MRRVTSLIIFLSSIILLITGIVLFIVPQGRVAYWSNWKFIWLGKTDWSNLHTVIGYLFLIFSVFHIYYNWRSIVTYLKDKMKKIRILTFEFNIAFIIVMIVSIGTIFNIPPFSSFIQLSDFFKANAALKYGEPPYGHAELSSLKVFSKNIEVDVNIAKSRLLKKSITVKSNNETIQQISNRYSISPRELFYIIKPPILNKKHRSLPQGARSGIGRFSLKKIADKYKLNLEEMLSLLKKNNIKATPQMNLKQIAQKNKTSPADVYEIILKHFSKK